MKLNNKKGFSLVELSIVLIIVALLIAGVISGKSLINNSKMNVINSEVNTLKIALRSYIDNNGIINYDNSTGNGKISLYNMIEEGYLDEPKNYSGTSVLDKCYPSKISGGCWYYQYNNGNSRFELTLASKVDQVSGSKSILDSKLCTQFMKKFTNNSSKSSKHNAIESSCDNDAHNTTGKKRLNIYLYDIFS